jgi:hypothetical protein
MADGEDSRLMAIPTQRSRWQRFWNTTVPYEIGAALSGTGTSAAAAQRFFTASPADPFWGTISASGAALALGFQLMKLRRTYAQQIARDGIHDLAGCLHTLNAILIGGEKEVEKVGLRSTVHVTVGKDLVQALDYVGDQRKKNTQGRRMPVNCGVIGKACREKDVFFGSRTADSYEDFLQQMIKLYSFDEEGAKRLDPLTQAWIAGPLMDRSGNVEGVLYCDCKQRDFFTEERQRAIAFGAAGIAFFVGLRYS